MKILSRKEQDEVLKRIAACQIICNKYIGIKTRDEIESGTKMTENLADIAVTVGGESGADKVMNTVHKYNELNILNSWWRGAITMTGNEVLIKTPEEAIETIKSNMPTSGYQMLRESLNMAIEALKEVQYYRGIGTVEDFRESIEKQIPKIPDYEGDGYADGYMVYDTWICPNCGTKYEIDNDEYEHCPKCGQAIQWENEYMGGTI